MFYLKKEASIRQNTSSYHKKETAGAVEKVDNKDMKVMKKMLQ